MKDQYSFLLVHDKFDKYFRQLKAMHLMAGFFLIIFAFLLPTIATNSMLFLGGLALFVSLIFGVVILKNSLLRRLQINQMFRVAEIILLSLAAYYFYKENFLLPMALFSLVAVFILVLLVIESKIFSKQYIILNLKEILYPQIFTTRSIPWQNVTNVVLRFQVLTVEMKDGSFVQQTIAHNYSEEEVILFNNFIKQHLA